MRSRSTSIANVSSLTAERRLAPRSHSLTCLRESTCSACCCSCASKVAAIRLPMRHRDWASAGAPRGTSTARAAASPRRNQPTSSRRSRSAPASGCLSTGLRRRAISAAPSSSCVSGAERFERSYDSRELAMASHQSYHRLPSKHRTTRHPYSASHPPLRHSPSSCIDPKRAPIRLLYDNPRTLAYLRNRHNLTGFLNP